MAAKKKSSFYHTRWNHVQVNEHVAADILGISVEEIKRFDAEGAPVMAERLLLLWDKKHIGHTGWDGWLFSRGILRFKNRRYSPETLLLLSKSVEEESKLRNEIKRLYSWKGLFKIAKSLVSQKIRK